MWPMTFGVAMAILCAAVYIWNILNVLFNICLIIISTYIFIFSRSKLPRPSGTAFGQILALSIPKPPLRWLLCYNPSNMIQQRRINTSSWCKQCTHLMDHTTQILWYVEMNKLCKLHYSVLFSAWNFDWQIHIVLRHWPRNLCWSRDTGFFLFLAPLFFSWK